MLPVCHNNQARAHEHLQTWAPQLPESHVLQACAPQLISLCTAIRKSASTNEDPAQSKINKNKVLKKKKDTPSLPLKPHQQTQQD